MGCAFPTCAAYILHGGTVMNSDWVIWCLSGPIFLGIGDSAAAILGKLYGKTKWRETSNKTREGSSYLIYSVGAIYFISIQVVNSKTSLLVS